MTELIKKFIEMNIEIIEAEDWDSLYDEANDHLFDRGIEELTSVLSSALGLDMESFAKDNLMKHFVMELNNLKVDHVSNVISMGDFITYYMPTINGIDAEEFQGMAEEYLKGDPNFTAKYMGNGDLYIIKRGTTLSKLNTTNNN